MEEDCANEFITDNLDAHEIVIDTAPIVNNTLVATTTDSLSLFQELCEDREDEDHNKPSTSNNSMSSILQEEYRPDSQHNFAEVLDDETTSGVLEAFDISASNSLPTCTTTTNASSDSVAVQEDSSSTDSTIQIMKANSDSGGARNNPSLSDFFNNTNIFVINEDEDADDVDNDLIGDDDDIETDIVVHGGGGEGGDNDNDIIGGDEDTGDGVESADKSCIKPAESNDEDDLVIHKPITTNPNILNISKMSITPTSQMTESMNDVLLATNADIIYLETPIGEEQQQHEHLQMEATCSTNAFLVDEDNEKKGKSNNVDKESSLLSASSSYSSSSVSIPSTKSASSSSSNNVKVCSNDTDDKLLNIGDSVPERKVCTASQHHSHEDMSTHLKKMNLNKYSQDFTNNLNVLPMLTAEDIESMDLIERRDYEQEERLTGGVILKTNSIINNDVLNLSLLKSTHMEKEQDLPLSASNILHNTYQENDSNEDSHSPFAIDDLNILYPCKDPPNEVSNSTSSSRSPNCTAKTNMSATTTTATLSQNKIEGSSETQQQQANNVAILMSKSPRKATNHSNLIPLKSKSSSPNNTLSVIPSASMGPSSSNQPNATYAASIQTDAAPASSTAQTINTDNSNSNSNDSFMGTSSSSSSSTTSSSNSNFPKPSPFVSHPDFGPIYVRRTPPLAPVKYNRLVASKEFSAALNKSGVVMQIFQNGCSRTNPINTGMSSSGTNNTSKSANQQQEDDPKPSTSSARCPVAWLVAKCPPTKQNSNGNNFARANTALDSGAIPPIARNVMYATRGRSRRFELAFRQHQQLLSSAASMFRNNIPVIEHLRRHWNFNDRSSSSAWKESEDNSTEIEEICTCQSTNGLNTFDSYFLNNSNDMENSDCQNLSDKDNNNHSNNANKTNRSSSEEPIPKASAIETVNTRKRKHNRLVDHDYNSPSPLNNSPVRQPENGIMRKRYAYDMTSIARSSTTTSSSNGSSVQVSNISTPNVSFSQNNAKTSATITGRRSQRSLKNNQDASVPDLQHWIAQFKSWTNNERLTAVDRLIEHCEPTQVRHMMKIIEPQLQRDFISLLPRELALQVLSNLHPKDLLKAAQTCRSWRFLCDDNLLWKEKCREVQIFTEPRGDRPRRGRAGNMPPIASPWKAAYIRQHIIEMNWRARPIRDPKVLKGHDEHVITCLQFSGNRIVSGSDDNTLKVWSAVTGRCLRTLVGHTGGVWSSQLSGNIIISGSTDRTLKVWDMETGHCVHTLQGHTSTVRCMHLNGKKVVSGSRDATLRVWNIEQGTCLRVLVGHLAAVRCVQYDGKLIVSGAYDYMVKVWHPDRSECLHTLQGHTNRVYSLQFDGTYVVSGSLDTSIRVWDVENGTCKHTLMGHQSLTSGMELRENILVSGNADSTVKVWDITTGQCLQTLSGPNKHQSAVTCLQFNSRFVVTSSDDGTVKLWDVKTGEFIRNLVTLESGGSGGVVWRIRTNDTKLICAVGSRNGTEETKLMVLDFDVEGACVKCS